MTPPKISFIVPVYKVEPYLTACVESILGQSFRDFELILVDDGSPDRCGEMCDAFAERDTRVRVIHQPNGGLSNARNTGIEAARGEYLWFVDSDDCIHAECLAPIVHQLEGQNLDMLILSYTLYFEELDSMQLLKNRGSSEIITGYDYIRSNYYEAFAWQKVTRASLFRDHGLRFDESLQYEDIQISPFLLRPVRRLAFSNYEEGAYCYRIRPDSITTTTDVDKQRKQIRMCFRIEETWREKFDFATDDKESYDYAVKTRLLKMLHSLIISIVIRSGLPISEKNAVSKELIRRGILLKDIRSTIRLFKNEPTKKMAFFRALALSPRLFSVFTFLKQEIRDKLLNRSRNDSL